MFPILSILGILVVGLAPESSTRSIVTREQVDLIEFNHFVDEDGREVFRQVIFYDWSKKHSRYHVRAWRLIKRDSQVPQRHWDPHRYTCTWLDDGVIREVNSRSLRETWTQQDPERVNRQFLPEDKRVPLFLTSKPQSTR